MEDTLGLRRGSVRLVDYDSSWPRLYDEAAAEIVEVAGSYIAAIEHYGSTAVPGLRAKPIIDLLVAIPGRDLPAAAMTALNGLGYQPRPTDRVTGHHFFARGPEDKRTHYLYVCAAGTTFWVERIAFRDALREDPRLTREYCALKNSLAEQFPQDRLSYTNAKAEFIASVLSTKRLNAAFESP